MPEFIPISIRRIGQITGVLDPQRWPLLTNTRLWGVDGVDLGANAEHLGRLYIFFGDVAATDEILVPDVPPGGPGPKQIRNSDLIAWTTDPEVLEHGGHWAPEGSWEFFLPNREHGASEAIGQPDWRFCGKCQLLFWAPGGHTVASRCPYDDGKHAPIGWTFCLPNDHQGATAATGQLGWRFCTRCHGLCWSPLGEVPVGLCPAGGRHAPLGWIFALPNDRQGAGESTGQGNWRFCGGCESLFFDGFASKGVCPGPIDNLGRPIPNGGGNRLEAVRAGKTFFPFTATNPVGVTASLETPGGAFSHNGRVYVFVNVAPARYSEQVRPGDPAFGTYLTSSGAPDRPEPFITEFLFSPRIGACDRLDIGALASHDPRGFMFVLQKDAHGEWQICRECAAFFRVGGDNGHCFGTGGSPHVPTGDRFTLPVGGVNDVQNQSNWRRCGKCQTAYWDGNESNRGHCPSGGSHTPTEPVLTLPHRSFRDDASWQRPVGSLLQRRWRFCPRCAGIFWEGHFREHRGACPAGGGHDPWGHDFLLEFGRSEDQNCQTNWRFCGKCHGLFWSRAASSVCPKDHASHQLGGGPGFEGFNFGLTHGVSGDATHQSNWRFCGKCSGLFWAGAAGICPSDLGAHQAGAGPMAQGFDFVLPHDPGEDPLHLENCRFCQQCFSIVWAGQLDWFAAVQPCEVSIDQHSGFPPSPSDRGLVLLGFGYNPPAGFRLAWMPLPQGGTPRLHETWYWQGRQNGVNQWSPRADDAKNLFNRDPVTYTSISLTWLEEPGIWVMLYSLATDARSPAEREGRGVARFAATPWELATAREVTIFDPAAAYGIYMNDLPDADRFNVPPCGDEHKGWAYGLYLIKRYTRWRSETRELDLVYLLSLSSPYQVQLMKTTVRMI